MQLPLQVTFRNLPPSPALTEHIRTHALELERFHGRLISCRVLVEAHPRHHRRGRLYHVRVDLGVPGGELVVSREHALPQKHEDAYVAVREAFAVATRQLEDFVRRQRGGHKLYRTA
jgi:ribosome-associated translation inhibitor RaiA